MAQLLDTVVNGNLEVSGKISQLENPTLPEHVVNKSYFDKSRVFYEAKMPPIGGNHNSSGSWIKFTTGDYSVELEKGVYQVTMNCNFDGHGTGFITVRVMMNGTEIDGESYKKTRQTTPCDSVRVVSTSSTFLLNIETNGTYNFRPEAFGTTAWTGARATIAIVRIG